MPRCQSTLLDLRDYTCCTFWTTAVEMLGQLVRNTICTTCGQTAWIVFSSPILGTCMIFIHNGVSHIRPTGGSFRRSVFTIRVVCFWNECSEESQSIHPWAIWSFWHWCGQWFELDVLHKLLTTWIIPCFSDSSVTGRKIWAIPKQSACIT